MILAWLDGTVGVAPTVVEHLNAQRAPGAAIFGGTLAFPWGGVQRVREIADRAALGDALVLLLIAGPLVHAARVSNAWRPVGPRQRVRSQGATVARIGERTALAFHRHYLGDHLEPAFEFPLAVFDGASDRFYLRVPRSFHAESGEVSYSAAVPDGAEVQLCEYVRPEVIDDTASTVAAARDDLEGGAAGALVFSCAVRKQVLGTRISAECQILREQLPRVPFAGFYAYGEIAPLVAGGPAFYHNATMITLLLGERPDAEEAEAAAEAAEPLADAATPRPAPTLASDALARKLARSESYRARLEETRELQMAMLRTISAEIDAARRQIAAQNAELRRLNEELAREQRKSEELLLNILPREVADELRRTGRVEPVYYDAVSVLFTDFAGFTRIARTMSPAELLAELDFYFSAFDAIIDRHGLEKLKTIGDAYMCAGGIPAPCEGHAIRAVEAAWEMQAFMAEVAAARAASGRAAWELRIGVHTGPLMAGVIGQKKFAYDIWGDTVNIASRLESTGAPGRINISAATHAEVRGAFECEHRGRLAAKNAGEIDMYFVVAPRR
ncbi:MAG: FIST C-terminal domain-containing protein [Myxococcales bacterium]|nr:FIST C-terminal domain-containing protein [Myxococcales bacterium]